VAKMNNDQVRQSFNKLLRLYFDSCQEVYEELGLEKKLSSRQFYYLNVIHDNQDMTVSKFALLCELKKPTVTEIVNRFEQAGMIQKRHCNKDKRQYFIELTDHGRLLANTNELESRRVTEKITKKLSTEEVQTLTSLLDQITGE
jgi:DNA-binding MarR family transcriptional regulator